MNKRTAGFSFVALAITLAVLLANVLAITPHLHQRLHGASPHECVITLIAAGKFNHAATAASSIVPDCLRNEAISFRQHFPIAASTLEFSLREHAPPSVS